MQNKPVLNVEDIQGVVGSNIVSTVVDASSAQVVRGKNISHSSGSTHDSIVQKVLTWFLKAFLYLSLLWNISTKFSSTLYSCSCWMLALSYTMRLL